MLHRGPDFAEPCPERPLDIGTPEAGRRWRGTRQPPATIERRNLVVDGGTFTTHARAPGLPATPLPPMRRLSRRDVNEVSG